MTKTKTKTMTGKISYKNSPLVDTLSFWVLLCQKNHNCEFYLSKTKGLILLLIFPVLVLVLVLVIVLLQCLPSSSVQSYRINIAKAL